MLTKIKKLKNVKKLSKMEQKHISGGSGCYPIDPCPIGTEWIGCACQDPNIV